MNYSDLIIFIMEMMGTVAFAASGAMLGIRKKMDLFGVCVLGVTTSVGGGMIRDIILGIIPPGMFRRPVYTFVAIVISVGLFVLLYMKQKLLDGACPDTVTRIGHLYELLINISDAIGLGIFTVVGINTAWNAGYHSLFLVVFVGVLTGVGGGLLRDVMAQEKPYILTKHIYACASLIGALVCVYTEDALGNLPAMMMGACAVVIVRFLAMHYRWNLPRIE